MEKILRAGQAEAVLQEAARRAEAPQAEQQTGATAEVRTEGREPGLDTREMGEIGVESVDAMYDSAKETITSMVDQLWGKIATKGGKPRALFKAFGFSVKAGRDAADAIYGIQYKNGERQDGLVDLPRLAKEGIDRASDVVAGKIVGAADKVVGAAKGVGDYYFGRIAAANAEALRRVYAEQRAIDAQGKAAEQRRAEFAADDAELEADVKPILEREQREAAALKEAQAKEKEQTEARQKEYGEKSMEEQWQAWEDYLESEGIMENGVVDRNKASGLELTEEQIQTLEARNSASGKIRKMTAESPIRDIPDKSRFEVSETNQKRADKLVSEEKSLFALMGELFGVEGNNRED